MDILVVESSQTILLEHLMKNYSKEVRPWNNGTTEVKLDVAIVKLILVVGLYNYIVIVFLSLVTMLLDYRGCGLLPFEPKAFMVTLIQLKMIPLSCLVTVERTFLFS